MPPGQVLGKRVVWDDAADKRFLMAMLKVLSPTPPKFEDVAEAMGDGVTATALSHRWVKLKKMLIEDGGGSTSKNGNRWSKLKKQIEGTGGDGPETPAKKTPSKPKATPKSASKRKAKEVSEEDDNEEVAEKPEEDNGTPAKKAKTTIKQQSPEEDDDAEWMV